MRLLASTPSVGFLLTRAANHAPVALNGSYTVTMNGTLNGAVSATDADGDTLQYSLLTRPKKGSLTFSPSGTFSYVAASKGTSTFQASDPSGAPSNTATVTITVKS